MKVSYYKSTRIIGASFRLRWCAYCGGLFRSSRSDAKYCGVNHRMNAYNARKRKLTQARDNSIISPK